MDPVVIMLSVALAAAVVGVVAVIIITMNSILDWFRARARVITAYRRAFSFTIAAQINGKKYTEIPGVFGGETARTRIVQGIYDTENSKLIESRMLTSSEDVKDQEVIAAHEAGSGMVIYL
jgi:hypothetical protein